MAGPCHIVHLLYRFAAGGLENVIVQLVNGLPRDRFRHTIVALTSADPAFVSRFDGVDAEVIELHKPPGQPFGLYPTVYRLLRRLHPDVLHSCNLAALEFQVVAWAARVPVRVHAEHGWDIADPDGRNVRYRWLRKVHRLFVDRVIAVSPQLHEYLAEIGIPESRLQLIPNGVDTARFRPAQAGDPQPAGFPFRRPDHWVIGTVGRLEPIKNQLLLADAFIKLLQQEPSGHERLRLAIVGDGPLLPIVRERLVAAGFENRLWLPGARSDIPEVLRAIDCFVLPSLAEGTSCTLQEAMATGLTIVTTDVGNNAVLLQHGRVGRLVPSADVDAMARALGDAFSARSTSSNESAREAVEREYALSSVLARYSALFLGA